MGKKEGALEAIVAEKMFSLPGTACCRPYFLRVLKDYGFKMIG